MSIWLFLPVVAGIVGGLLGGVAYKKYNDKHKNR